MFPPTLISRISELTKDSSVPASILLTTESAGYGLYLLIISTRYDSGMLYKELGHFNDHSTAEAAAFAALASVETYEECQLLNVTI